MKNLVPIVILLFLFLQTNGYCQTEQTTPIPVKQNTTLKKENLKIFVSEEGKSLRRAGSKRCVNKRMLGSGYQLQFESYQEGYFSLLDG